MPDTTLFPPTYFAVRYFARSLWAKEQPSGSLPGGPAYATFGSATFAGSEVFAGMAMQVSTPIPPFAASFRMEVDWDDDGFLSPYSDISATVVGQVNTLRGRDYASQLTGRSVAGSMTCNLRNQDGRYSSFNTASPLYGIVRPGLKVRVWALRPMAYVLWTGELANIMPSAAHGGEPMAGLQAVGAFRKLSEQSARLGAQTMALTGDVINAVLDEVGWPAGARQIEHGQVPVRYLPPETGVVALQAIQEMEEAEIGFAYEGLDWDLVFEDRYHRDVDPASTTPVETFSDSPPTTPHPYSQVEQLDPLHNIFNRVTAVVTPYQLQALGVLWTGPTPGPYLVPGASVIITAEYTAGFVSQWVGLSIPNVGGLPVYEQIEITAHRWTFKITNTHLTDPAQLGVLQAFGIAYLALQTELVQSDDAASQAKYRSVRAYSLPSPWHLNTAWAQATCDYFIAQQSELRPVLTILIPSGANPEMAYIGERLNLSDRITLGATSGLTRLGISEDFFIESIGHTFGGGEFWWTRLTLSRAGAATHYWTLDVSHLGVDTQLAY